MDALQELKEINQKIEDLKKEDRFAHDYQWMEIAVASATRKHQNLMVSFAKLTSGQLRSYKSQFEVTFKDYRSVFITDNFDKHFQSFLYCMHYIY